MYINHNYPDDHALRGIVQPRDETGDETGEEEEEGEASRILKEELNSDSDSEDFSSEDEA